MKNLRKRQEQTSQTILLEEIDKKKNLTNDGRFRVYRNRIQQYKKTGHTEITKENPTKKSVKKALQISNRIQMK